MVAVVEHPFVEQVPDRDPSDPVVDGEPIEILVTEPGDERDPLVARDRNSSRMAATDRSLSRRAAATAT
jgi:hypothetical protein